MKVLVLMGGDSTEREISLRSGEGIVRALGRLGHDVRAIDPATGRALLGDRAGAAAAVATARAAAGALAAPGAAIERDDGGATGVAAAAATVSPPVLSVSRSLEAVRGATEGAEVVFVALHGGAGEDGTIQALLDLAGVPYTGSGVLASAAAMNKDMAKRLFREAGIPTPRGLFLSAGTSAAASATAGVAAPLVREFAARTGWPIVVKPNDQGSTVGVTIARDAGALAEGLALAARHSPDVLVEEYIPGRELTVAVLGGEALPVVEVVPESGFYDYEAKYTKGRTQYDVPADLPEPQAMRVRELGVAACAALGCRGVARVDFRLHPDGTPYCLEVNTVPGMTELSLVPMAARAVGIEYDALVDRVLRLGVSGRERASRPTARRP
jgi:D-alanine-D-alanine ligase